MSSTVEVAREIGVSKNTLLRWLQEGHVPDVERDWRGWRVRSEEDIRRIRAFKTACQARNRGNTVGHSAQKADYAWAAAEGLALLGRANHRSQRTA